MCNPCFKESSLISDPIFQSTLDMNDLAEIQNLPGPIVVLGAGGFIGSNMFFQLLKAREDVYACGINLQEHWRMAYLPDEIRSHQIVHFDITNDELVTSMFKSLRPQTVFNFCAHGAYEHQNNSDRINEVNLSGVRRLLTTMTQFPVRAFVNAGTSSEYGLNCAAPKEDAEKRPNSEYAISKLSAGEMVRYFGEQRGVPAVHLRIYSVYGPWEEPGRFIPKLVEHGLNGEYPSLVSPEVSRDFVYIDDCLRSFVKVALQICVKEPGAILNVGTGVETTIAKAAEVSAQLFGLKDQPKYGSMRPRKWDLKSWYANTEKLDALLKWKPTFPFALGLQKTLDWEKRYQLREGVKKNSEIGSSRKKISVVVACYKDSQAIPLMYRRLVESLGRSDCNYEIIFVNDASPEGDREAIHQIVDQDPRVIGITHSRNFGSQSAFLSGLQIATGDAVVLFDGDLQDPPEVMEKFIERWKEGFEVVYGQRSERQASSHMRFLYRAFYRLFRSLADIEIPLDAGDFSLIDRKVVDKILTFKERDFFLRGIRAWVGYKQVGVPYYRPERMFGKSTNSFWKNIWWAKKGIFSFSSKPLDYIERLGLLVFFGSVLLGAFYLLYYFLGGSSAPKGITTLIILVLGLGGLQILSISVLGEYIRKIVEEVKGRPHFIRTEIYRNKSTK